ncbi:MAG: hypothetical protein ACLFSY_06120 [Desulfonatronovibrionaceae bacterium]
MNEHKAAFIERISAAATHEILNGLASVGQSCGLMQDLMALGLTRGWMGKLKYMLAGRGRPPDAGKRFEKSLVAVNQGMKKARRTTRALNRFIHSLTPSGEEEPVHQLLEVTAVLMHPFAGRKKTELEVRDPDRGLVCPVSSFLVYRTLAACVDAFVDKAVEDQIYLSCYKQGQNAVCSVQSLKVKCTEDMSRDLDALRQELQAEKCTLKAASTGFLLVLPLS